MNLVLSVSIYKYKRNSVNQLFTCFLSHSVILHGKLSSSLHVSLGIDRFDRVFGVISASFVPGCNNCAYERLVSVQTAKKSVPKARRSKSGNTIIIS